MEPIVLHPFLGDSSCWYSPNPALFRGQSYRRTENLLLLRGLWNGGGARASPRVKLGRG